MLNHWNRGSTLIEILIASSMGALLVLMTQQQLQWQLGLQHVKLSRVTVLLNGEAIANNLAETLENAIAAQISNPQENCYLFPLHDGSSVGIRLRNEQLQQNSMTLNCAGYGWQALTNSAQFKVTQFTFEPYTPTSMNGQPKLFTTLMVNHEGETQTFKRLITLSVY